MVVQESRIESLIRSPDSGPNERTFIESQIADQTEIKWEFGAQDSF